MAKKIQALDSWVSAHDAANLLSQKFNRPIDPKYIRTLSKRRFQPVRTQQMSNRLLYSKDDLEQVTIRQRAQKE